MTEDAARHLIEGAVGTVAPNDALVWADIGAGTGTFTHALAAILGGAGTVHAIERDKLTYKELKALAEQRAESDTHATVVPRHADFVNPLSLPPLSGILMANALHFVPHLEQAELLQRLTKSLLPHCRIVLVEYNRDSGHQWVPFPISDKALPALAGRAGLTKPIFTATAPSAFGGDLYCAWMTRV